MFFAEITDEMSLGVVSEGTKTASEHQFTPRRQENQALSSLFLIVFVILT